MTAHPDGRSTKGLRADRQRRSALLARLERWTDGPLTVLSLALIPILFAPYLLTLSSDTRSVLERLDYLIWGTFVADLVVKLVIAPAPIRYLRSHWFDVVLVALPMLRPLRVARSLRALRMIQASRAVVAGLRVGITGRRVLTRHGLHFSLLAGFVVLIGGGALATIFERNAPGSTIHDLPDGLWWAITTATTVGYGDTYPTTGVRRGIGVALMLLGITLFSLITANLASVFVEDQEDAVLTEVRALREEIRRLETLLRERTIDDVAES